MSRREIMAAIIIHGGAGGYIDQADPQAKKHLASKVNALREITQQGWNAIRSGKSAVDVVELTVAALEDNPEFNAGYGAEIGAEGVELDASIMDGKTGEFGGVTGITVVKNPIIIARGILKTKHNLYQGEGANALARKIARRRGLEIISARDLEVPYRREEWKKWQRKQVDDPEEPSSGGTVGVVVFDGKDIAAGTSTGGMTGKPKGRIGDTPLIGAGTFATSFAGASATGEGEKIMKLGLTRYAIETMRKRNLSPQRASEIAIAALGEVHGKGGIIILDNKGKVGAHTNSPHMTYAFMTKEMSAPEVKVKNQMLLFQGYLK